jgi:hypothetical protein
VQYYYFKLSLKIVLISNLNQNHKEKLVKLGFELGLVAVEKGVKRQGFRGFECG